MNKITILSSNELFATGVKVFLQEEFTHITQSHENDLYNKNLINSDLIITDEINSERLAKDVKSQFLIKAQTPVLIFHNKNSNRINYLIDIPLYKGVLPMTSSPDEVKYEVKRLLEKRLDRAIESPYIKTNSPPLLTPKEKKVINLLKKGYSNKKISLSLNTGYSTIRTHVSNILLKYGVNNRTELITKTYQSNHGSSKELLSKREGEIYKLVMKELSTTQISKILNIKSSTVTKHISNILKKTRTRNRKELLNKFNPL